MDTLNRIAAEQPYPLLFATLSGAHLYGFPSADSDFDVRGVHILPLRDVVGLSVKHETIQWSGVREERAVDLVTHDARKFFLLLLKPNGYVLEQLYSPLIVRTTPAHAELKEIGRGCITRNHTHHYLGFARTQWDLFEKERRIKPLLYVYRVLLTGLHLMRTGEIEANLPRLNGEFRLKHVDDLVAQKLHAGERAGMASTTSADVDSAACEFHAREYHRLTQALEEAHAASTLPEAPTAGPALQDLLLRLRGVN